MGGGGGGGGGEGGDAEPETGAKGEGGGFGSVEEVVTGREVFDAEEAGGGGECEEVDAAEEGGGEGEEEEGGGEVRGGHWGGGWRVGGRLFRQRRCGCGHSGWSWNRREKLVTRKDIEGVRFYIAWFNPTRVGWATRRTEPLALPIENTRDID